ncbi:MAG: hypothetical protein ACRD7E_00275 [Bryobacteraceae bacterium]
MSDSQMLQEFPCLLQAQELFLGDLELRRVNAPPLRPYAPPVCRRWSIS